MTEQEWLTSTDPQLMLKCLQYDGGDPIVSDQGPRMAVCTDRKLRLFACGCCRQVWDKLDKKDRSFAALCEQYADGQATWEEIEKSSHKQDTSGRYKPTDVLLSLCTFSIQEIASLYPARDREVPPPVRAALLRCIFGNPYSGLIYTCDADVGHVCEICHDLEEWCRWKNRQVPRLAQAIYDDRTRDCPRCKQGRNPIYTAGRGKLRWHAGDGTTGIVNCPDCCGSGRIDGGMLDPDRLAVLADALEESGCDNADILAHLRGPGPHARGCWVLDLLLGKE